MLIIQLFLSKLFWIQETASALQPDSEVPELVVIDEVEQDQTTAPEDPAPEQRSNSANIPQVIRNAFAIQIFLHFYTL